MEAVRIYRMPACRMASSGSGMFGAGELEAFDEWFSAQPRGMFPRDFLWSDGAGFVWYYMCGEDTVVPEWFEVIDFPGGLYAVVTAKDNDGKSRKAAMDELDRFLAGSGFGRDHDRAELGNIITPPEAAAVLGYEQMDYYIPIKAK